MDWESASARSIITSPRVRSGPSSISKMWGYLMVDADTANNLSMMPLISFGSAQLLISIATLMIWPTLMWTFFHSILNMAFQKPCQRTSKAPFGVKPRRKSCPKLIVPLVTTTTPSTILVSLPTRKNKFMPLAKTKRLKTCSRKMASQTRRTMLGKVLKPLRSRRASPISLYHINAVGPHLIILMCTPTAAGPTPSNSS